jgi:hypothetical protein
MTDEDDRLSATASLLPFCLVCRYRRDAFDDGPTFPVHPATHHGISATFEADIPLTPGASRLGG